MMRGALSWPQVPSILELAFGVDDERWDALLHVSGFYRQQTCFSSHPTYFCYTRSTCKAGTSASFATAVV